VTTPPVKIDSGKRQREDGGEQHQRFYPSQLADAAAVQQCSDLEIIQKGKNPAMQSFGLLLFLAVLGTVHLSLFFLILLRILANPMYQKAKGFSRLTCNYFNILIDYP